MFCDVQIYFKSANKRRIAVNKITTVETAFCVILGHHKKSGKKPPTVRLENVSPAAWSRF